MIRSINLVLVIVRELLESQENCLSPKNWLSQKINCQKVRIYPILALRRPDQNF